MIPLTHCPICNERVDSFATCRTDEPFTSYSPIEGMRAWGAYDLRRTIVCYSGAYCHFRFDDDGETRLVKLLPLDTPGFCENCGMEAEFLVDGICKDCMDAIYASEGELEYDYYGEYDDDDDEYYI